MPQHVQLTMYCCKNTGTGSARLHFKKKVWNGPLKLVPNVFTSPP